MGIWEVVVGPAKIISGQQLVMVQGNPQEAYDRLGVVIDVSAINGLWDISAVFEFGSRQISLAVAAGLSTVGLVMASKVNALVGRELPTPRPSGILFTPTGAGSITSTVALIYS